MFKSKEELIKEIYPKIPTSDEDYDHYETYQSGVNDAFKSIAERKEFYKIHRESKENTKLWASQVDCLHNKLVKQFLKETPGNIPFDTWLFDYCFDGVK